MSANKTILEQSAERLMPSRSFEESLTKLLLAQARRNLLKYQMMDRRFQKKYQKTFEQFRAEQLDSSMPFEVEQDYFDWELAITGIGEMEEEIERLEALQ
ncbi:MAG: hypothetical protein U9Q78_08960 [Chloroflexota bacterium]|nr:hypothetical protein [Chloroflexota bacterium]